MDIVHNDFDWEKQYVATKAVDKHKTWEEYVKAHRVTERFKPDQVVDLRRVWNTWKPPSK